MDIPDDYLKIDDNQITRPIASIYEVSHVLSDLAIAINDSPNLKNYIENNNGVINDIINPAEVATSLIKKGKYGKFTACSAYPECKYIKKEEKKIVEICDCPKCGHKIIEKKTKKGKIFYGCNNYPKCKYALWDKPTGEICPNCGGLMVDKKNKVVCADCGE